MSSTPTAIHWFRKDLRLYDNPSLASLHSESVVLPIYILDTINAKNQPSHTASNVWLHHALNSLNTSLSDCLSVYAGNPLEILQELCSKYHITKVVWNRCYEPWSIQRDTKIKAQLETQGIEVKSYNASLLFEPFRILKADGTPYKVFSPFYYKGCLAYEPHEPVPTPKLHCLRDLDAQVISKLHLLPELEWAKHTISHWNISEEGALQVFEQFVKEGLPEYKEGRNLPSKPFVSRLSPYIHFGQISVHHLWHTVRAMPETKSTAHFLSELGWREFSYNQLYYNPTLATQNLQAKFNAFPWDNDVEALRCWQQGNTGVPFVDAGMRELWQTGYMHNRVRMVVASFLVKNLLLDWRLGAQWFMETLFDADEASNSASWQWVAGCGYDSAPYFRIFNPVTQGQKFDPEGEYIKQYIPELRDMPIKYLYAPWEAPGEVLTTAGVSLEHDYPYPIVDLKESREKALAAFRSLKQP